MDKWFNLRLEDAQLCHREELSKLENARLALFVQVLAQRHNRQH